MPMMTRLQVQRRSIRKQEALSATDEFWLVPAVDADASAVDADDDENDSVDLEIPPAHHQLFSEDIAIYETLKGYNHRLSEEDDALCRDPLDDLDDLASRFSTIKQRGGGSWLLGFARLSDRMPPGLVRDDDSLTSSGSTSDDDSLPNSSSHGPSSGKPKERGVSFNTDVKVQPVPHSSTLSATQRRKMYSSSMEVRQNKQRNKKEYRFDGCDWRNATEEWQMAVDMVTGELVHPVHEQY